MNTNGTMANSSKKRKASELDSDPVSSLPKSKSRRRSKAPETDSKAVEDIPFRSECPYQPTNKANDDAFVQREVLAPGFEFDFAIRPGLQWKNMRSYRNVKLQDHTFSVGTVIYVNKQIPPPKSPRSDATDDEILNYDRKNFWVGRIADTRAESDKAVFLRVFWLYWPEELPMGRQSYHGDRELVLSNAMDIVDAQTISWAADLTFWDEKEVGNQYRDRFWRQTFDISQLGKDRKGGLSELRKHCICQQPHNPDRTMFECKNSTCMTWNHEDCLVQDVLRRVWPTYDEKNTLDNYHHTTEVTEDEGESSLRNKLTSLGSMVQRSIAPSINAVIEQSVLHTVSEPSKNGDAATAKKLKQSKKPTKPNTSTIPAWDGHLKARVMEIDDKDTESPVFVEVEEAIGRKSKNELRVWRVSVNCLVCGQQM